MKSYKIFLTVVLLVIGITSQLPAKEAGWDKVDDGLFVGTFNSPMKSISGDSRLTIIKIDPNLYSFKLLSVGEMKHSNLTAKEWSEKYNLIGVVNAGMFREDYITNVGYMKNYDYINNSRNNSKYFSVSAFNPIDSAQNPNFQIYDIDEKSFDDITDNYHTVIQNLRLIKSPAQNRWSQQDKKWSEVALGQDTHGNALFIFCRSPYSMHDLINILKELPIDIDSAQHLEGGPEASLYLSHNNIKIEMMGSYETSFMEDNGNNNFWEIPNVIGFVKNE